MYVLNLDDFGEFFFFFKCHSVGKKRFCNAASVDCESPSTLPTCPSTEGKSILVRPLCTFLILMQCLQCVLEPKRGGNLEAACDHSFLTDQDGTLLISLSIYNIYMLESFTVRFHNPHCAATVCCLFLFVFFICGFSAKDAGCPPKLCEGSVTPGRN